MEENQKKLQLTRIIDKISKPLIAVVFYPLYLALTDQEIILLPWLPILCLAGAGRIFVNSNIEEALRFGDRKDKITSFLLLLACIFTAFMWVFFPLV